MPLLALPVTSYACYIWILYGQKVRLVPLGKKLLRRKPFLILGFRSERGWITWVKYLFWYSMSLALIISDERLVFLSIVSIVICYWAKNVYRSWNPKVWRISFADSMAGITIYKIDK